jgi:hypothetical protein
MCKAYSKHLGEQECIMDFGGKARRKVASRKTYKYVGKNNIKMDLRERE